MSGKTAATLLTPDILLRAYSIGLFPMAESADDLDLHWVEPHLRGVFPLDRFHIPAKLLKLVRSDRFRVTVNQEFAQVMDLCAAPAKGRETTWINGIIRRLYGDLHRQGHAHSVEVYDGETLVGGLYGVSLAGAFFGESMFHLARDASKVALVHLVARLIAGNFRLLDAQFITPHLAQFGAVEIPRAAYQLALEDAMDEAGDFLIWPQAPSPSGVTALATIAARQQA